MQDIIDKHKVRFRVLENWSITYKEDNRRKNKCYWDRRKKEAFIYPLTIDVDPTHYVIHELLHICQAAKRGKGWKETEEVYVQDMTEMIFGFLKITGHTETAYKSDEQQCNIADVSHLACFAPEYIKPCRHEFSGICQYNGHCNFKQACG